VVEANFNQEMLTFGGSESSTLEGSINSGRAVV